MPLPTWREFLERFAEWHCHKDSLDAAFMAEIRDLLDRGKFLLVAEELLERSTDDEFATFLDEIFDPKEIVPTFLHKLISVVPFRAIVTSNYDNLVEQSYVSCHKRIPKIFTHRNISALPRSLEGPFFILKIHGDIEDPKSIVLSHRSYVDLLYNSIHYRRFLEKMFSDYVVLFIGYGGNDPDIEAIYDKLTADTEKSKQRHYMLVQQGSITGIEKNRFMRDRRIALIEYVDHFGLHNHIDTFLADLAWKVVETGAALRGPFPFYLRSRVMVAFDAADKEDGEFLRNYFFRQGAITHQAEDDQRNVFLERFSDLVPITDIVVVYLGNAEISKEDKFTQVFLRNWRLCEENKVPLLIVASEDKRGTVEELAISLPVFYVPREFSEKDLSPLQAYLENIDRRMHGVGIEVPVRVDKFSTCPFWASMEDWVGQLKKKALEHLASHAIECQTSLIEERWAKPPYAAIWSVSDKTGSYRVWVITGDLPTYHLTDKDIKEPRHALQVFASEFNDISKRLLKGLSDERIKLGSATNEEMLKKAGVSLQMRAKDMQKWADKDSFSKPSQGQSEADAPASFE